MTRSSARSRRGAAIAIAMTGLLGIATACQPVEPSGPRLGDGTTTATAGASCYGIHRAFPAASSGVYWLLTPAMTRPAQYYCDMVTDGGGWVLVARGREGWQFLPTGQGTHSAVRSQVSGPGAFAPAALDSTTIAGLVNGSAISALSDGIRVERATTTTGSRYQQLRLYPTFSAWTWAWPAGQLLKKIVVDGRTYQGSNTKDTYDAWVFGQTRDDLARVQGTSRLFTFPWTKNDDLQGFSFGSGAPTGSTSSTSYLWQRRSSSYSIPFTRIWLRPRLSNAVAFGAIPAGGYPPAPERAGLKSRSEPAPWGVVGIEHTGEQTVEPWNTNVLTVKATPTRVFVGGRFTGVQHGPTGTAIAQPSLAAFDLDGNWISTFRPVVAGRVWDMVLTPDGKLIVAGDFTSINGAPGTSGMAALDPTTGAVIAGWRASASRVGGTEWRVRALEQRDGWIYAAGVFDRVVAGPTATPVTVADAVSVSVADGSIGTWRPVLNGSAVRIQVTDDGTRILLAGYFTSIDGNATHGYFGITNRSNGAVTAGTGAWIPSGGSTEKYQQAVADLGDRLVVGGSEHDTQLWNKARTKLLDAAVTRSGGDTQVIEVFGDKAYVGCHCGDWVYQGTNDFANPNGFRSVEPINLLGVWDTKTWTYDTSWYPNSLKGEYGEGVWTVDLDVRGCLWAGGDLVRGAYSGNAATDWLGGFARFCPLDDTPPSTPATVTVTDGSAGTTIAWTAATDPGGGSVTYDVVRNDRVVASVSGHSWTDAAAPAGARYTVRAVDARGNRSGSRPPVTG